MLLAGFMGSSCIGIILDKTKKFRLITFVVTCFYFALYLVFSFLYVDETIWLDNFLLSFVGAGCSSMFNLLLQFGIELTYPESVTIMVGLNGLIQQLFGVVITQIGQVLISNDDAGEDENGCLSTKGATNANISFLCWLGLAILLQVFIKEDLKRMKAEAAGADEKEIEAGKENEAFDDIEGDAASL